jgi:hypothetical protein
MADGSTKFKNSINVDPQSADPSNPAEGDIFVSDGTSRAAGAWQYISGAWAQFGGGGAGGINYMTDDNTDAENGVGDWATYDDGAAVNPVDGTAGSPTVVTFTQNTSSPLRGTADFKFAKTAADGQGEGAGCAFTIDAADKAQMLTISFDYDASDANYADDDIRLSVYDVTNTTLIRVNGEDLKGGKGKHIAQFQTASDSTSYRLIIHQSSTNATAYNVYFDNIQVGPREVAKGAAMTDWESYTPTANNVTLGNGTVEGFYRRNGDGLDVRIRLLLGSTTSITGTVSFTYPNSISADTSKMITLPPSGICHLIDVGTSANREVGIVRANETTLQPITFDGNVVNSTSPFTWANTDYILCEMTSIPIQGWSSNAILSEDLGGREVVVRGAGNSGATITANTERIDFSLVEDTTGSWSQTDGNGLDTFTAPETGSYVVTGTVLANATITADIRALIDASADIYLGTISSDNVGHFSGVVSLNKGQTFSVIWSTTATLSNSSTAHSIHIQKMASPQTNLDTAVVAARYEDASGQTINSTTSTLTWNTVDSDSHNALSSGVYTIPVSGFYDIDAFITTTSVTLSTSQRILVRINIDSDTKLINGNNTYGNGTARNYTTVVTTKIHLDKGQTVEIQAYSDVSDTLGTSTNGNYFSIARIK